MDRDLRLVSRAALAALLVMLAGAAPAPLEAATVRSGGTLTIARGDTLRDDLYVAGGTLQVFGVVDGDLVITGGSITLAGPVLGDLLSAGGTTVVRGSEGAVIGGTMRSVGGRVRLDAPVGRDAVIAGGRLSLGPRALVAGDALLAGGEITVDGTVRGDARIGGGRITLGEHSLIGGDLHYSSERALARAPGAVVGGRIHGKDHEDSGILKLVAGWIRWLRGLVGLAIMGLLAVTLFPGAANAVARTLGGSPGPSLLTGIACGVGIPMLALMFVIVGALIGGWWIGVMLMAGWWAALTLGYVIASVVTGRWLTGRMRRSTTGLAGPLLLGLFVLGIATAVPIMGKAIGLGAALLGVGAIGLMAIRARQQRV